jgi:pimeloyl-ACP methyl ester carboxylesterase
VPPDRLVVLLHSSVSGRRQWRSLAAALAGRYRVAAPDLIGYGEAPAWAGPEPQRLGDQAAVVHRLAAELGDPYALVGHSFGASVALAAAAELGGRLERLVLIEPNPFWLLRGEDPDSFAEAAALRELVKAAGAGGDWPRAAERFADYWNGAGTWAAMGEERRAAFARALQPNYHEWDAVLDPPADDPVAAVRAGTQVLSARDTVAPIARIVEILERLRPDWRFTSIERGGHMAPLTAPELVDPLVAAALA